MWISKIRYYKIASRCNVKELRYLSWLYSGENKKKGNKVELLGFGGFLISFDKEEARRNLPPNVAITPSKILGQMVGVMNGR